MLKLYKHFTKQVITENLDLNMLLYFYRYTSLLIASLFYLLAFTTVPIYLKVGVPICLALEAYIFIKIYNGKNEEEWFKKTLILTETVGLAFILTLTGGIESPFIWYAINPILLAATLIPTYFCWTMMATFISFTFILRNVEIYGFKSYPLIWPDHAVFILIFVLITLIAQLYSYFIKKLSYQNKIMVEQIRHIKALYETIEVFNHHSDPQEIVNLFSSYCKSLTKSQKVIIWVEAGTGLKNINKQNYFAIRGPKKILSEDKWFPHIKKLFEDKDNRKDVDINKYCSEDKQVKGTLITNKIKSKSKTYGIISAFYTDNTQNFEGVNKTLAFLADLCAVAMDKQSLGAIADEFLLVAEKDRIASEIHDNVSQNLFGMVYALDILSKKYNVEDHVYKQIKLLQKTAQRSIKELRLTIYSLSTIKSHKEPFIDEIKNYLSDLEKLNDITVKLQYQGCLSRMNSSTRKGLFRIIREGTGNAIRHGHSSIIQVSLVEVSEQIVLSIIDNGCGFKELESRNEIQEGIGLINMKELVRSMRGIFEIESNPGIGTKVYCEIPLTSEEFIKNEERLLTG